MLAKTVKEIIPDPHPETLIASSSSLLKIPWMVFSTDC